MSEVALSVFGVEIGPAELVFAIVFAALGVRSAVYWFRHPVVAIDLTDELLFAAFVTGRVGTWFLASGMFVLFGTIHTVGRAYTDDATSVRVVVHRVPRARRDAAARGVVPRGARGMDR